MKTHLQAQLRSMKFQARHYARGLAPVAPFVAAVVLQNAVVGAALADTAGTLSTVTGATDSVFDTINAILRPLSLIAIIGCGVAGGFGKMEWGTVIKVMIGVLIANSATTILDFMSGGTTAT